MTARRDGETRKSERPKTREQGPLVELDRVLRPVRRVVNYALRPEAKLRYFEANVRRHLAGTEALDLPVALREVVDELRGHVDGFDEAPDDARRTRLSTMFAALARLDAVTGLPLPSHRPVPIRKPIQVDEPEPVEPAPEADPPDEDEREGPELASQAPEEPPVPQPPPFDDLLPLAEADPGLAESLSGFGLSTVGDVLHERPTSFETFPVLRTVTGPLPEGRIAVGVTLLGRTSRFQPDGTVIDEDRARLTDDDGEITVTWSQARPHLTSGARVVLVGLVGGPRHLIEAEIASASGNTVFQARYRFFNPDIDRSIRLIVDRWDRLRPRRERDPVPPAILKRHTLLQRNAAWAQGHRSMHEPSRQRLAFDEALIVALAHRLHRGPQSRGRGIAHNIVHGFVGTLGQMSDLTLDDGQQSVLEEIKRELRRPVPMRRVITGEVGAGKGAISLMATAIVAEGRSQVLVLAHDEAGAHERFLHNEPALRESGLVARIVSSPPTGSQRDAIRRGEIHVVYGTVDLLAHQIEFRRLGLVVAAEREPWGQVGVHQMALPSPRPDLLVTTAVPVGPRILMTAYHDFDVSVLVNEARRPARISLCAATERSEAYTRLRDIVATGRQAVVVFPMMNDRDAVDVQGARRLVRALENDALQGLSVGLLHGALSGEERRRVHDNFLHRRLQVLVCTSRIEDGPAVPAVGVVVVEQAEAVDAWRLHRIIGFFSKSRLQAEAWLVAGDHASPESTARLRRLQQAPSGVALTETLAELSGVNKVVTEAGIPLPQLTWLDLDRDLDWVLHARREAKTILDGDPSLRRGNHAELAQELLSRWPRLWPGGETEHWGPPQVRPAATLEGKRRRRRRRRRR